MIHFANEPFRIPDKAYWDNEKEAYLYWLDHFGPKARLKMLVREIKDFMVPESVENLWCCQVEDESIDPVLQDLIRENRVFRINTDHKDFEKWLVETPKRENKNEKKRVNIMGLGDVGSTMALALCLYGKDQISRIGIYDLDENRVKRWEQELNQIAEPLCDQLPKVEPISKEALFECDLFAFTASVGVPPVSITEGDVRMVQFAGNSKLVGEYAEMAVASDYKGIFAIVSDPVDQLCRHAFEFSNSDQGGIWHGRGLAPEQIRGYGLGVMNGRAAYYAKLDGYNFNLNGRVYGPHGKGLVVANDWRKDFYNERLSEKWTEATITANLRMREIGYKPYIAPAVASGAISIIKTLASEQHYSCISFNGFYYGCLNQLIHGTDVYERVDASPELVQKIKASVEEMKAQWNQSR